MFKCCFRKTRPFFQIQTLSIFPLTCREWPSCVICWGSGLQWVLSGTPLMCSPTSLDFCHKTTELCVWSMVGKASFGMWVWENHVGLVRGFLFSVKGLLLLRLWQGQRSDVSSAHSAPKTHSWCSCPEAKRAVMERTGCTASHTFHKNTNGFLKLSQGKIKQ